MEYNEVQKKAISHKDGPMMVLAGPGSGKTAVIVKRVLKLIEGYQVSPEQILVITFSKAASIEMKERFFSLCKEKRYPVQFGTFHAVFFHILRTAYHYNSGNIVNPILKRRFLEEAIAETSYEVEELGEFVEDVEREISLVKSEGIAIEHYFSVNSPEEIFRSIYRGYEARMRNHRQIDFDDMIVYTYDLLRKRQDILAGWQRKFTYILVDEFQDINRLQYENLKLLAAPENNLFIVGDDDQSIYGFRGAKPDIMLHFPREFVGARQVILNTNYRCTNEILHAAQRLISHNKKRYSKQLTAFRGKGGAVHIVKCKDLLKEKRILTDKILEDIQSHIAYHEIAVLFRTNQQVASIAGSLLERNIPFVMKEGIPNLFEHFIAKDIIAYIKLGMGERNRAHFLRIANRPKRYMNREVFAETEISFADIYSFFHDKPWMEEYIDRFQEDVIELKFLTPYTAIDYIRKGIGYDDYIREYAAFRGVKADDWLEVLDDLQASAKGKKDYEEWFQYIDEYGDKLRQDSEKRKDEYVEGVQLLTMHGAKGLEFESVYIADVNEGVTPYRKAVLEEEIEEERRMFYVAMTRAKGKLTLFYLEERYNKEVEPSRFLAEIAPKLKKRIEGA